MDLKGYLKDQRPLIGRQRDETADTAVGELINTVTAKLGSASVRKAAFRESYIPERSFSYIPLSETAAHSPSARDRPARILPHPEEIQAIAMLPDKPPSWIKWRGVGLKTVEGIGPERIAGEWWRDGLEHAGTYRDYFKVQDETGRWLWIYRDARNLQWFLHGIWA